VLISTRSMGTSQQHIGPFNIVLEIIGLLVAVGPLSPTAVASYSTTLLACTRAIDQYCSTRQNLTGIIKPNVVLTTPLVLAPSARRLYAL